MDFYECVVLCEIQQAIRSLILDYSNQDKYEKSLPDFIVRSLVNEKIIPRKINENKTNARMTPDFLASTEFDIS